MKLVTPDSHRSAFTLLELMLVIAIISILAALLLPVLEKGRARSRETQCLSQLRQVGVGYHAFAHDHTDQFPFQVSTNAGGTKEFVGAAGSLQGNFYFAFRHFQAVSNEFGETKILVCPADRGRTSAANFGALRNENISYFAGVTAEYAHPDSFLSGDGNISRDGASGSFVRLSSDTTVFWTREGHGFRGNILFADGHVEKLLSRGLQLALARTGPGPQIVLPPITPPASSNGGMAGGSGSGNESTNGTSGSSGRGGSTTLVANQSTITVLQQFLGGAPEESSSGSGIVPATSGAMRPTSQPVAANALPVQPGPQGMAAAPAPIAKAGTNQLAAASTNAAPATGAFTETSGTVPVNLFLVLTKPETCWTCWLSLVLLAVIVAILLAWVIQRRHEAKQRRALEASAAVSRAASGSR